MEHIEPDDLTPDQSKALERLLRVLKPASTQGASAAQAAQAAAVTAGVQGAGLPFETLLTEARAFFVEVDPAPEPEPGSTRWVFEQGAKIWTSPEPLRTLLQMVYETGCVRSALISDEAMARVADAACGKSAPAHGPGPRVAFFVLWEFALSAIVLFSCAICPAFPAGVLARLRFEVPPVPDVVVACLSTSLLLTLFAVALHRYATTEREAVERSRRAWRSLRTIGQLCVDARELNMPDATRRQLLGEIVRISGDIER